MSIFKRGKHAKAEVPGSSYGSGAIPVSEEREPVELSAASIQHIVGAIGPLTVEPDYNPYGSFPVDTEELSYSESRGEEAPVAPFEVELDKVLGEVRALLLEKNASYGDSALNPVRIMSDADAAEQIRIRMDDKLSRLYRGFAFEDTETGNPEDTLKDLVGYYFLLKIAEARNAQS